MIDTTATAPVSEAVHFYVLYRCLLRPGRLQGPCAQRVLHNESTAFERAAEEHAMCSDQEYRRRLVVYSHDRLVRLHSEAGLLLDLKDPLGAKLAQNVAGRPRVREVLRHARRRQSFAVLCIGIPRLMARAMAARQPEALAYLDALGQDVLPVIIISAGGCSVAGVPKDFLMPGLN